MSKKCISLGQVKWNIFLIFIPIIFRFGESFAESQSDFYIEVNSHPMLYTLNYSLGLCLSFILFIIYKRRNRTNAKNIENTKNKTSGILESKSVISAKKIKETTTNATTGQ